MNVLITLTSAGVDTGPFNLYSNVDTYTTAFETNISRGILLAGYTSTIVPPGTTAIRVKSTGVCQNYVDLVLTVPSTTTTTTTSAATSTTTTTTVYVPPVTSTTTTVYVPPVETTTTTTTYIGPATTTTTTTSPATTTTTTTSPSTTTTTTTSSGTTTTTTSTSTTSILVSCQEWRNDTAGEVVITYTPCGSGTPVSNYTVATTSSVCAVYGSVNYISGDPLTLVGQCSVATTTTTSTTANPATTTTTTTADPTTTTTTTTSGGGGGTTTTTTTAEPTTTTTTTTSGETTTTSTTTTQIIESCQQWINNTESEMTITYTPCGSGTPVSNYALATTSSVCAVYGSITIISGGPLDLIGPCTI